ncbi:MAG TPA: SRPBCC family protein [Candidatus Acidoferrum sp.]|nr:SRPBCC family protein [Candidatus Acidoferrum sp.]
MAMGIGSARGHTARGINVGNAERIFSVLGGVVLGLYGLGRIRLSGVAFAALGGALVYRGMTGHCKAYESLGIDRASTLTGETRGNRGVKIEREIVVNAPPEALYRMWRDLQQLPRFMSHVECVERLDDRRSRWTLTTPPGVPAIQWEAEIINDQPGELIAWQSVRGTVDHAGSVRFERMPEGHSTRVRVELQYDPPGGEAGHTVAALFGQDAGTRIENDLSEFKRAVEAGEVTSSTIPNRRVS